MINNLFFILFFISCNFLSSGNSYSSDKFVGNSIEELNQIISGSFLLEEEFADETEKDDFSNHLMLFASDFTIIKTKSKEKNTFINGAVISKAVLLNFYIDLPPPGIS